MKLFETKDFGKQTKAITFKGTNFNRQLNPSKITKKNNKKKNKTNRLKHEQIDNGATSNAGTGAVTEADVGTSHNKGKRPITKLTNDRVTDGRRIVKAKLKQNNQKQQLEKKPHVIKAIKQQLKESKLMSGQRNEKTSHQSFVSSSQQTINDFEMKLQAELLGGRFRYINEQLYTMRSDKAAQLFHDDPTAFQAYHEGYRRQLKKWPINPLNRIIRLIRRYPKSYEIGDFGCGDGQLAKSIPNKVYSFDLVSLNSHVIACDMAHTPLQNSTLNMAVYCLSLMNSNLDEFLLEANRVLKLNGLLIIAEIQSRFDNVKQFTHNLESYGFHLIKKDTIKDIFYLFQFKKTRHVGKVAVVQNLVLKPCLYKKR